MAERQGKVEAIWIKRRKRGEMAPAQFAILRAGRGIAGNADQGGKRQVTIISSEVWQERTRMLRASLSPSARRANVLVSGINLENSTGRILRLGQVRLRIGGETRPCQRMDEAWPGLKNALAPAWGGGAYGEVLDNGEIEIGDSVFWEEEILPGNDADTRGGKS